EDGRGHAPRSPGRPARDGARRGGVMPARSRRLRNIQLDTNRASWAIENLRRCLVKLAARAERASAPPAMQEELQEAARLLGVALGQLDLVQGVGHLVDALYPPGSQAGGAEVRRELRTAPSRGGQA